MTNELQLVLSMALFAFVSSISPGPNNMMLLSSGVNFGFRRTLAHIFGISCGFSVMLLAVGSGLMGIFQEIPLIYQVMKVAGFAYLLYLAWGIANSGAPSKSKDDTARPMSFMAAALFQWINPKAWLMCIGLFSSYMPADASAGFIFAMCFMFGIINCPSSGVWALIGNQLVHRLQNQKYRQIFNWVMAGLLILSMIPVLFV